MKTTTIFFLILLITAACDPTSTATAIVENQTSHNAVMTLYLGGQLNKDFLIERGSSEVIYSLTGLAPLLFDPSTYDSIRFVFENGRMLLFLNDTIHQPNDIYKYFNWSLIRGDRYDYTTIYTLTPEMLE